MRFKMFVSAAVVSITIACRIYIVSAHIMHDIVQKTKHIAKPSALAL